MRVHLAPAGVGLHMEDAVPALSNGPVPQPATLLGGGVLGSEAHAGILQWRSIWHDNNDTADYTQHVGEQLLAHLTAGTAA
jgi:hypothetical protein